MYMIYLIGILFAAVFCIAEYYKATEHMMNERREEEYIKLWEENQRLMKEVLKENEL